jgi:acetyl-CoA carboxylase biotin carboxylase subunit
MHVPSGPGVRWDGGIAAGSEVSLFYDPMVGKLIVWAPSRAQALERMHRALRELTIAGLETSRDFHLRMMENDDFRRGAIDIQWLERTLPALTGAQAPLEITRRAIIAAALLADRELSSRAQGGIRALPSSDDEWTRVARLESLR